MIKKPTSSLLIPWFLRLGGVERRIGWQSRWGFLPISFSWEVVRNETCWQLAPWPPPSVTASLEASLGSRLKWHSFYSAPRPSDFRGIILGSRSSWVELGGSVFGFCYWISYRRNFANENIRLLTAHPLLIRPQHSSFSVPKGTFLIYSSPWLVLERADKPGMGVASSLLLVFCFLTLNLLPYINHMNIILLMEFKNASVMLFQYTNCLKISLLFLSVYIQIPWLKIIM